MSMFMRASMGMAAAKSLSGGSQTQRECSTQTRDKYYMPLPVWLRCNAYFNGAVPCRLEEAPAVDTQHSVRVALREEDGRIIVESDLFRYLPKAQMISTDTLGMAFEPEEYFETPEGEKIVFDTDLYGIKRSETPVAGPIEV